MARDVQLYLIRHGIAAARGDAWPDDTKRPLTEEGVARLRREGRGLVALDVAFDVILSSPLVRTRETAEALAAAFASAPPIVFLDALAPGTPVATVIADVQKHARKERVAVVGHEPGIGELAARLIGARHPVAFKKGAVARIDVEVFLPAPVAQLRWLLTPKILRTLGR